MQKKSKSFYYGLLILGALFFQPNTAKASDTKVQKPFSSKPSNQGKLKNPMFNTSKKPVTKEPALTPVQAWIKNNPAKSVADACYSDKSFQVQVKKRAETKHFFNVKDSDAKDIFDVFKTKNVVFNIDSAHDFKNIMIDNASIRTKINNVAIKSQAGKKDVQSFFFPNSNGKLPAFSELTEGKRSCKYNKNQDAIECDHEFSDPVGYTFRKGEVSHQSIPEIATTVRIVIGLKEFFNQLKENKDSKPGCFVVTTYPTNKSNNY